MFASIGYDEELTAQKAYLAARCEVERLQAGACFAELEAKLGWWNLAWQAVKTVAPYTRLGLPIAGALLAKMIFKRRPSVEPVPVPAKRMGGTLALVWQVARWLMPLVRQWMAARRSA